MTLSSLIDMSIAKKDNDKKILTNQSDHQKQMEKQRSQIITQDLSFPNTCSTNDNSLTNVHRQNQKQSQKSDGQLNNRNQTKNSISYLKNKKEQGQTKKGLLAHRNQPVNVKNQTIKNESFTKKKINKISCKDQQIINTDQRDKQILENQKKLGINPIKVIDGQVYLNQDDFLKLRIKNDAMIKSNHKSKQKIPILKIPEGKKKRIKRDDDKKHQQTFYSKNNLKNKMYFKSQREEGLKNNLNQTLNLDNDDFDEIEYTQYKLDQSRQMKTIKTKANFNDSQLSNEFNQNKVLFKNNQNTESQRKKNQLDQNWITSQDAKFKL